MEGRKVEKDGGRGRKTGRQVIRIKVVLYMMSSTTSIRFPNVF